MQAPSYLRQQSLLKPNNKGVKNIHLQICCPVQQLAKKSHLERRFEHDVGNDNLQKKQCLEQQQKCCPGKWPFYRNICQEDRCRICSVYCISMVKYWHAVWLNIALHFLFVGKFKKAGAIKGQVIMEQLFAASYRLLPAAAVQYTFIKSNYFFLMYKLLQRSNLYTFIQWESQGKVLCLYLV